MRLKYNPKAKRRLSEATQWVVMPDQSANWADRFALDQPIRLEIGAGKGQFAIQMAQLHPEINWIAMELQDAAAYRILELQEEYQLDNLQILVADAADLQDYFPARSIDCIYLNFSDPWPKNRHTKRRLTSTSFLAHYHKVLKSDGELHLKTDNMAFFEYSIASLSQNDWIIKQVWLDLHQSDFQGNVTTNYEDKFAALGQPIYRLEAYHR